MNKIYLSFLSLSNEKITSLRSLLKYAPKKHHSFYSDLILQLNAYSKLILSHFSIFRSFPGWFSLYLRKINPFFVCQCPHLHKVWTCFRPFPGWFWSFSRKQFCNFSSRFCLSRRGPKLNSSEVIMEGIVWSTFQFYKFLGRFEAKSEYFFFNLLSRV